MKKSIREARMKGAVAETLAEARKIGTGIMFTLHGQEVYRKHAKELAKGQISEMGDIQSRDQDAWKRSRQKSLD